MIRRSCSLVQRILWLSVIAILFAGGPPAPDALAQIPTGQPAGDAAPPMPSAAPIRLRAGTFVPGQDQPPDVLSIESVPAGQAGYHIVQFAGPVHETWKDAVVQRGGAIFDYLPDFAFIVRMDDAARSEVAKLPEVAWVGPYQPGYKLSPELKKTAGVRELVIQLFPEEDADAVIQQLRPLGVQVEVVTPDAPGGLLRVRSDLSLLGTLAQLPAVRWIEPFYERVLLNDIARGSAIMGAATAWTNLGLYGQGQVVAVSDTGLDTGSLSTLHSDFRGAPTGCTGTSRILAAYALGRSGDWSDSCHVYDTQTDQWINEGGHGTHVTGSVLGNGCRSGSNGAPTYAGSYAGLAPQAGLVMQSVMDSACGLEGLPADLNTLFAQARTAGARIHTNSWGSAVAGLYTVDSQKADLFTWNNKDYTILFAAGNEGLDSSPRDGYIDQDSLSAPGTAKNVITVGASENYRLTGGANCTWGACFPDALGNPRYPAEPIASDRVSNNPTGMTAFSSRGPTDDGRIKPDVVAPGANILSTKSQGAYVSSGWGAGPNAYYQYNGGTSMATPLTAGAMALIRQYYTDVQGIAPSAALLKATVINSAADLYPGQYTSPLEQNPRRPNFAQGWGRVNVADAVSGSRAFLDVGDADGLGTGGSRTIPYAVCDASAIKVTLVWTDYPGANSAGKQLVNDLDLTVTAPDGATYRGNVFVGGWSTSGGAADRTNNVESVYLSSPAVGSWTVTVSGYNVPSGVSGKQGYALVVDRPGNTRESCFAMQRTPAARTVCAPDPAIYNIALSPAGGFADPVTLAAAGAPAGATATLAPNPVTPPGGSSLIVDNTAAAAAGTYTLNLTGTSGALHQAAEVTLSLATGLPAAATLTGPADGSRGAALTPVFTWDAVPGAISYDVQVATDPEFGSIVASATGLTGTSFTPDSALSYNTVYYWRVQATNGCGVGGFSPISAFHTVNGATTSLCRSPVVAIPDNTTAGASDTQMGPTAGTLLDLNVSVQATHTWVGDLSFAVQNVDTGTSVTIMDRPGVPTSSYGCGNNHINATLDDGSVAPVENQCATSDAANPPPSAIDGTFAPNNALSIFNGQQLAATWRLTASDRATSDTGTLTQWCLIATYSVVAAADTSDLPASYGIAWHTGDGALRLGETWDADTTFNTDSDNSTDDGVAFAGPFQAGAPATLEINVQGTPSAGRWVRAWFDWNDDGGFGADELVYDGGATDGINRTVVNVPNVTTAVEYRVRLYDSATAPGVAALEGANGGEVEDGSTPCVASAAVAGIAISEPGSDQVRLAWTAPAGAARYQVWRALNEPYFGPGADCGTPGIYTCIATTGTSFNETVISGDPTYIVRAMSACGGYSDAADRRVGRFRFDLTPGE